MGKTGSQAKCKNCGKEMQTCHHNKECYLIHFKSDLNSFYPPTLIVCGYTLIRLK